MTRGSLAEVAVPQHWRWEPLWSIAPRVKHIGHPDLEPLSVFLNVGVVPRSSRDDNHNQLGEDLAKYLVVQPGDLVFNKLRTWQGGLGVSSHHGIVSPAYFVCRPNPEVFSRYLHYLLLSQPYLIELTRLSKWMPPSQFDISWESLRGMPIALPSYAEQRRIADFLDAETARIDQMLRLQALLVTRLEERDQALRDGLIDQAASEHGEIPLRRFITHIEQGVSPQCDNSPRVADAWAVLKLSSVKRGNFIPDENKALPQHEIPSRAFEVRDGDFLVTRANTPSLVGDVAVVSGSPRRLLLPDLIYRVGLTTAVDPSFIMHVALASRTRLRIEAAARGSSQSMVKLRGDDIREWPVPAINLEYQRQLTASIEAASRASMALYAAIKTKQQLLAERRQALITAAVTGQIDVTTARGADAS